MPLNIFEKDTLISQKNIACLLKNITNFLMGVMCEPVVSIVKK